MGRLIVDTSGYLAGTAARHPLCGAIQSILRAVMEPPVISPFVIAEIDYMVLAKVGVAQELAAIDDLTGGAYEIAEVDADDVRSARSLVARHRDLKIGITDAFNAVLADRYDTNEILTTDERHFRAITPLSRRFDAFALLPADRL
ncbi:Ribonuclease VapC26 [Frankia canadensis]|uniref:Ribonuclease VapC n=1 Tax=Frankia canadensis TaxID=1836972 RepID=A0A2I2KTR4_9ACTN|nr:PIN domain-containing protein [Frankia canadensis]SNQ49046.1 Ribonuclease VapC26 [Frankia canadensis]SOU56336.1 Ribonuclease VapC26 [Frankia canadensis]